MTVASASAADVGVSEGDLAVDTLSSTDDSIIDSTNPEENLAIDDTNDNDSVEKSASDDSQNALKASNDDVLKADPVFDVSVTVGPDGDYPSINAAIASFNPIDRTKNYEIVILNGTYTGTGTYIATISGNYNYLLIRAAEGANVTFDGQEQRRILRVQSNNVDIRGITFINGVDNSSRGWGPAEGGVCINVDGNYVSVENCTFLNSGGTYRDGGAIHVSGHDFNLTNCYFENCFAQVGSCVRAEQGSTRVTILSLIHI